MSIFRPPPRKPRGQLKLTDKEARLRLKSVRPTTYSLNGNVSYPWQFVRETRTNCGTLAFIWRDPFDASNERVWAVDFETGICKEIGKARPPAPQPIRALPPAPKMLLLPPPSPKAAKKRLAEQIGEAFLRGFRGRAH